jgi:hypothetical protein
MPAVAKDRIWCTCCKKFLTRKREREHRQAATQPYIPPVTSYRQFAFLSALFSDDEDDIPALATVDHREDDEDLYHSKSPSPGDDFEETSERVLDPMDVDDLAMASDWDTGVDAEASAGASDDEDTISHSYRPAARASTPSDSEDDDDLDHNTVPQEDPSGDDEVDAVDWDALEKECGLSAWDQLGESYEAEAAGIGVLFWYAELEPIAYLIHSGKARRLRQGHLSCICI